MGDGLTNIDSDSSVSESDCDEFDRPSVSTWLDDGLSSTVKEGQGPSIKITRQCFVDVVKYLHELPSYWPVPQDILTYAMSFSCLLMLI